MFFFFYPIGLAGILAAVTEGEARTGAERSASPGVEAARIFQIWRNGLSRYLRHICPFTLFWPGMVAVSGVRLPSAWWGRQVL